MTNTIGNLFNENEYSSNTIGNLFNENEDSHIVQIYPVWIHHGQIKTYIYTYQKSKQLQIVLFLSMDLLQGRKEMWYTIDKGFGFVQLNRCQIQIILQTVDISKQNN